MEDEEGGEGRESGSLDNVSLISGEKRTPPEEEDVVEEKEDDYDSENDDVEERWIRYLERKKAKLDNDLDGHKSIIRTKKYEFDDEIRAWKLWRTENLLPPLSVNIALDILSRLPLESILDCREVCRAWRNLIRLTYFADLHIQRRLHCGGSLLLPPKPLQHYTGDVGKVGFLFLTMDKYSYLYYGEYYERGVNQSYMAIEKINHAEFKKRPNTSAIVGSCNGLVCTTIPCSFRIDDPVHIFNPISNEFLYIPRFVMPDEYRKTIAHKRSYTDFYMVSGFGYDPSTDLYKVVRIFYCGKQEPSVGQVQVYTLAIGLGWRNKGKISYTLFRRSYGPSRGLLAEGALHWLDYKEWKVVAFDLGNEKFSVLPTPPCFSPSGPNNFQIHVLGGCLCVAHDNVGESFDIWSFKKKAGEWERTFKITFHEGKPFDVYWPIALTMSGQLLLRYDSKFLVRYNPRTATLEKIPLRNMWLASEQSSLLLIEAIPHIHSFVSLKALDRDSCKRKRTEDSD